MSFFRLLKNIFFLLIFLQFAPMLWEGVKREYAHYTTARSRVGVLSIKEVLNDSTAHVEALTHLMKDQSIKAVLIKIDCSGTAAGAGDAVHHEIKKLRAIYHKPIVALVENMCTSGAYLIACAADSIIAPGTALIGSIGATFASPFLTVKDLLEGYKVQCTTLQAGKYKSSFSPFNTLNDDDKNMLQEVLDDSYEQFTTIVAADRKLSLKESSRWADGKLHTGKQALKLGLIDKVGSLSDAVAMLKEKALIEHEIEWVPQGPQHSWFSRLLSSGLSTALQTCSRAITVQ